VVLIPFRAHAPAFGRAYWACRYCLSSLSCISSDSDQPCPDPVPGSNTCPSLPQCNVHTSCESCVADDACAYCADPGICLTVSDSFQVVGGCRGQVFDAPCPDSFVGVNRVIGNLIVESDPAFGGGELHLDGQSADGEAAWSASLAQDGFELQSAAHVSVAAGNASAANTQGGSIALTAGDGLSADRGSGGSIELRAGDGAGEAKFGSSGAGGRVLVEAGAF
jgi:hypothetical protein